MRTTQFFFEEDVDIVESEKLTEKVFQMIFFFFSFDIKIVVLSKCGLM